MLLRKATLLNKHFASIFEKEQTNFNIYLKPFSHEFDIMEDITITTENVIKSILKLKNSVSRTPDSIPAIYLRHTYQSLATPLTNLYNHSINSGELPKIWKY